MEVGIPKFECQGWMILFCLTRVDGFTPNKILPFFCPLDKILCTWHIYIMLPYIRSRSCFRKSLCQKDYRKVFLSVVPYVKIKPTKDVQHFGSTEGAEAG